jgi:hypothetical protein
VSGGARLLLHVESLTPAPCSIHFTTAQGVAPARMACGRCGVDQRRSVAHSRRVFDHRPGYSGAMSSGQHWPSVAPAWRREGTSYCVGPAAPLAAMRYTVAACAISGCILTPRWSCTCMRACAHDVIYRISFHIGASAKSATDDGPLGTSISLLRLAFTDCGARG